MTDMTIIGDAAIGIMIMICLDILAGLVSAASRGEINSTKLRQGLLHKLGLVLAFALAVALEYEEHVLPIGMSTPLVVPVSVYIIITEACSVYENIRTINPDFTFTGFDDLFKKIDKEEENNHDNLRN